MYFYKARVFLGRDGRNIQNIGSRKKMAELYSMLKKFEWI